MNNLRLTHPITRIDFCRCNPLHLFHGKNLQRNIVLSLHLYFPSLPFSFSHMRWIHRENISQASHLYLSCLGQACYIWYQKDPDPRHLEDPTLPVYHIEAQSAMIFILFYFFKKNIKIFIVINVGANLFHLFEFLELYLK